MIDPTTILAFSMHKYKGIYALLVGSGISRAAGIPTGWEVVLDLTRQVAIAQGKDAGNDPAAWYRETFGKEPDYSELLAALAKSPAERSQLLRPYFEPQNDEERRQGIKLPTLAHKAIARLVAHGHIRVIVTTNFDRLLELALEAENVYPSVIATPDAVEGALPLVHTRCTIIKVNGDYRDTRIRNTPVELSSYEPPIDGLLNRVFDEYGLIVSGWSGEWDTALRAAIVRSPNHRFSTFWLAHSAPRDLTQEVVTQRQADVIRIMSADNFFQTLEEQVTALDALERPHPLSARVMAERVKRYIEDSQPIRLRDVVMQAANDLRGSLDSDKFSLDAELTGSNIAERLQQYEALSDILVSATIVGCYWDSQAEHDLWTQCIERLYRAKRRHGDDTWRNLLWYPALLAFYSAGIAALAGNHYASFVNLIQYKVTGPDDERLPLASALCASKVLNQEAGRFLPECQGELRRTPTSDHLYELLRTPFEGLLYEQDRYEPLFDRFEFVLSLVQRDFDQFKSEGLRGDPGRYAWKCWSGNTLNLGDLNLKPLLGVNGNGGMLLQAGLLEGSTIRLRDAQEALLKQLQQLGWGW